MPNQQDQLAAQVAELTRQVNELQDHADIHRLIDEYGKAMDERRWEDWEAVFSEDAVCHYPWGETHGRAGMGAKCEEILKDFLVTEHLSGNVLIDLEGDHARSRRNVWITCIKPDDQPGVHFTEGGVYTCEHVRTPDGWRFSRVVLSIKWAQNGEAL